MTEITYWKQYPNYYSVKQNATYTNSKLYDAIKSKKSVLEKTLRIDIHTQIREMFEWKLITNIHHISTIIQLPNVLTKKVASAKELLDLVPYGVINI